MAMVIARFHRLIQSRLLWAAFLVVIIFSFVVWGTQTVGRATRSGPENTLPGRLDGKAVPFEEFRNAWHSVYVGWALRIGQPPRVTDELDRIIRREAWRRLAALREAERLGLKTTDDELVRFVQEMPFFQNNGRYDPQRYRFFLSQTLLQWGYTRGFFLEYIRGEITMDKLRRLVESAALVPSADIETEVSRLTDVLKVEYAVLSRSAVESEITVTEAEARAVYEANPTRYAEPPKVLVRAVFFSWEPHLERVAPIPEARLEEYYQRNIADFRAPAPPPEGSDSGTASERTLPFEEVRGTIERKLREQAARTLAREEAEAFCNRLSPAITDRPPSFDDAAAAAGLTPMSLPPFSENEPVAGFPPRSPLHRAAFDLRPTPDEYFSDPIGGEKGFYVLALQERIPSRVPAFEEVAERAMADARERRLTEALEQRARTLAEKVRGGTPMSDAAAEFGASSGVTEEFSVFRGLRDPDFAPTLVRAASAADAGEVPDPLDIGADRRLVLRVAMRRPADAQEVQNLRNTVAKRLQAEYAQLSFEAWLDWLVRPGRLEDLASRRTEADDE